MTFYVGCAGVLSLPVFLHGYLGLRQAKSAVHRELHVAQIVFTVPHLLAAALVAAFVATGNF